jgi:hypothetical protein
MMIPILDAILEEVLSVSDDPENPKPSNDPENPTRTKRDEERNMRAMLCFSVSLASNIGGTATTIGKDNFIDSSIAVFEEAFTHPPPTEN